MPLKFTGNPDYKTTFIFENDYAAVKQNQPDLPINEKEVESGGRRPSIRPSINTSDQSPGRK
jgi:galactose-1-phosphate uridylyltransferase